MAPNVVSYRKIHHREEDDKNDGDDDDKNKNDDKTDLLLYFKISDTGIKTDNTKVCLTGKTFSNVLIQGCDQITTNSKDDDGKDEN